MVESLGFLFDVITKDFHAIFAPVEPQWIIDLTVSKGRINTQSVWNLTVDFSHVGSFRIEFSIII